MKTMLKLAVMMVAIIALLAASSTVYASKDSRIESTAKKTYVFKTLLQDDDIKIASKNGAVTLTGTVANVHHKSLAQETVANISGVKSVDNKLEIKGTAPAENSDAWLTTKVKTMLLFHRNVSAMTEVNSAGGIVTLQGKADNMAQKDLTTEYVKDVDGVKDVKNEMTVGKTAKKKQTMGGKIDDASITALVKMTLLYHRSTSALNTSVATKRGVVTLTGKAKNAAEKDLATKFVSDVNGVKSVNNKMTVS
jgi:hyperosmotically inducible periplasmic protein